MTIHLIYYSSIALLIVFGLWSVLRFSLHKKLKEDSENLKMQIVTIRQTLSLLERRYNDLKDAGATRLNLMQNIEEEINNKIEDLEGIKRKWRTNKFLKKVLLLENLK